MRIAKGQILAITSGVYSDYNLRDHARALCDFDTANEIAKFVESGNYLDSDGSTWNSDDRFIAWAIREGLITPLPDGEVVEWHIGAYGELDIGAAT